MKHLILPPIEPGDHQLHIVRTGKYITMAVADRVTQEVLTAFTLHSVEAVKALEILSSILKASDNGGSFVEGVALGGPPDPEQLFENR